MLRFWNNEIDCNEEAVLEIILQELNRLSPSPQPLSPERARGPTEPNSCCGENMEADDEEYSARSEPPFTLTPSHRPERVRGLYKPVCCWGDNICTIRSPRPSGERVRVRKKRPPCPHPAPVGPGNYSHSQRVDYNNRLSVRTVY